MVSNPHFEEQRRNSLSRLTPDMIDPPIVETINRFNRLPYCFTLQCCYGHFVYPGQNDAHNLDPLPATDTIDRVEYRIAYVAFCVDRGALGKQLFENLKEIAFIDPEYIQLCSAEWFWNRQVNSYALQVEPDRFKRQDSAILSYSEALRVEKVRNAFFVELERTLLDFPPG